MVTWKIIKQILMHLGMDLIYNQEAVASARKIELNKMKN